MRSSGHSSLLGIALESGRMTAVLLRRAAGRVQIRQTLQTALSLDPVTHAPELVGREIRNHLSDAGIRETRCVVCVPLKWAMTLRTELPELSDADVDSFLAVQAERGFPFAPEDLLLSVSKYRTPDGTQLATVVGIPANRMAILQKALRAAKLRPVSITLGITSLLDDAGLKQEGAITLLVGEDGVDLAISAGEGVVALRALEDPDDAESITRQIRITLGQLPQDLRDTIRAVRVFGPVGLTEPLLDALHNGTGRLGVSVETRDATERVQPPVPDVLQAISPSALGAARQRLLSGPTGFEFLPPRTSRFKQITGRVSSRATVWLGSVVTAAIVVLACAFFYQQWRLSHLEAQWKAIEPGVKEVAAIQTKVRQFRPWFDDSVRGLRVARSLTEAFPEDGAVWATKLVIKDAANSGKPAVSCSGKARTNRDWLRMLERLRTVNGVEDLRFQQVTGKDPVQFEVRFVWNAGEANGD